MGCFKDNKVDPRPLPELLADLSGEVDRYHLDKVIQKCAELAHDKRYTYFGIQSFGQCMSGENAASTYNRDGDSAGCQSGLGGPGENLVFTVISLRGFLLYKITHPTEFNDIGSEIYEIHMFEQTSFINSFPRSSNICISHI